MEQKTDSLGSATVSADVLKRAVIEQAEKGFLGMLALVGQSGIKIQTDGGAYPLPDADYVVLMLAKTTGDTRVAWLRVEDKPVAIDIEQPVQKVPVASSADGDPAGYSRDESDSRVTDTSVDP